MKSIIIMLCLLTFGMNAKAVERPNELWGQCRPTPHVEQKFTLQGIELELTGTVVSLDVEGIDLVLRQGQLEIVLGHVKEFELKKNCHASDVTGFSKRFQVAEGVQLRRKESVGHCRLRVYGNLLMGYGLNWYRDVDAQYTVQAPEGPIYLHGQGLEWYYTLSDCLSRK